MCVLPDFEETPLSCRETCGRGAGPKKDMFDTQITSDYTFCDHEKYIKIPNFGPGKAF